MHQFLTVAMTSRSAAKLKAVDQARSKLEELTKYDYPCFTFMLTEEGPELLGEEDLTTELMEIFEERGLIEMAQRIKLRGQALINRSTRNMRIQRMQEAFSCHLPPPLLPLHELHDYDLIKIHFNRMMKAEGMGTDWQPGQDPPAKVRQWWGEEDHEVFRMYVNQNLPKELMDIVRARYKHFR